MASHVNNNSIVFHLNHADIIFSRSTIRSVTIFMPEKLNHMYGINLKLKSLAARDLNRLTKNNIGKIATLTLNGKILLSATIQNQLGGDFFIRQLNQEEIKVFMQGLGLLSF